MKETYMSNEYKKVVFIRYNDGLHFLRRDGKRNGRETLKNSWVKESLSVKMQPKNTVSLRIERKIKKFLLNPLSV